MNPRRPSRHVAAIWGNRTSVIILALEHCVSVLFLYSFNDMITKTLIILSP